ncbi:dipeptide ABC transporter ATP-binding protein [Thermatribacter velox]|uniref:Dipeptide ABC transporter ATP-binding protein n=1 Tax=Thermatribacter velox TaxID=3039681 RepID=A0ABZ2Y8B5_9BACT
MRNSEFILEVKNLKKYFPIKAGVFRKTVAFVKAVDGVSFQVRQGETFGIVGESGCGKSTLGMTLLKLHTPTSGKVLFENQDVFSLSDSELRKLRRNIQMIFQDPFSSLNPRMSVGAIIEEGLSTHRIGNAKERKAMVEVLVEKVGLSKDVLKRYPHEFSGGQRQRIGIARALALKPKLVIADEAVSALDVSIRSQIINLLKDLKDEFSLTYIFISHDLAVVRYICDRIMVMYLGKAVEIASKEALFENPLHPYTVSLISAVPVPNPDYKVRRIILKGDVPSPINPPAGCRFYTRCPVSQPLCASQEPDLLEVQPGHWVACHFPGSLKIVENQKVD